MMAKKTVKEKEEDGYILIKGARVNNLKNIDVKIPRDKFVVITGLSGSGKSSLAFDTLYAEGQRRYVESLSSLNAITSKVFRRQLPSSRRSVSVTRAQQSVHRPRFTNISACCMPGWDKRFRPFRGRK